MLKPLIKKLSEKQDLSSNEMQLALNAMIESNTQEHCTDVEIATFLTLLKAKGETADEIFGIVQAMQSHMVKLDVPYPTLDIVGTGGDGFNTINISSASALLAASCGVKVAKHGNRSASSMTGAADVLEQLGFNLKQSAKQTKKQIDHHNFGFLFAPNFHPALGKLKPIRSQMGIRTIFNLVGPLANPANAQCLMIGVAEKALIHLFSEVLLKIGVQRALIFNCQGLDEICTIAPVDVAEINGSTVTTYLLDPADYGFSYCAIEALQGSDAKNNAEVIKTILAGSLGPMADSIILNAGVANYLFGISETIKAGVLLAKQVHSAGKAARLIEQLSMLNQSEQCKVETRHA